MRSLLARALVVAVLAIAAPSFAAPLVEVNFIDPDGYTDASPNSYLIDERERDAVLAVLRKHLEGLGAKHLNDGDLLKIEILDLDLAGEFELWRVRNREVRVLRDITVPRIHLRYTLTRAGVESSGEERLAALNYLRKTSQCRTRDSLCHEKLLLENWLVQRLGKAK